MGVNAPRPTTYDAWAVAAPGLEALVQAELRQMGFADAAASTGGVAFRCDAAGLARANLHARLAGRIVVRVAQFRATAFHELERAARKIEWARFLPASGRFRLRASSRKSRLYHSDAVAQRVADAIQRAVPGATQDAAGSDPNDDSDSAAADPAAKQPRQGTGSEASQLFVVRFDHDRCTVSADASGALLHRRGYRQAVAKAPLRETLAAAVLAAAGYQPGLPLVDPFCGSGTICIEAALAARNIAPGLRRHFAAERWPEADARAWATARSRATEAIRPSVPAPILGSDRDAGAIAAATANAERAGVAADVEFAERSLSQLLVPAGPGLVASNPPYGLRVGERAPLRDLYARFGQVMHAVCPGWRAALLSADRTLERQTGLAFREALRSVNGGIPVRVVVADIR